MKRLAAAVFLVIHTLTVFAHSGDTLSSHVPVESQDASRRQPEIRWQSFILPGALITYGALSLHVPALHDLNQNIYDLTSAGPHTYERPYLEDYLLLLPAATVYGLNIFGVKGHHSVVDASVLYAISNLVSYGSASIVKNLTKEARPDGTNDQSFPSGHTTGAFVAAEFLNQEYRGRIHWSVIAGGYLAAGSVGYLRMYHNRHWFGDVVAGAGFGIGGTRLCYLLYPHMKRWIGGKKEGKGSAMLLPTYSPGGMYGLAFVKRF